MNKKVFLTVLMTFAFLWSTAKTDKNLNETGKSGIVQNAVLPTVKLNVFPATVPTTFQSFSATSLLESSNGLVQLSYPLNGTSVPVGEASVKVQVDYLTVVNDKVISNTKVETLKINLGQTIAKNIAYLKLPGAVRLQVTVLEVNIPASFTDIKLTSKVEAIVYDVLNIQKPQDMNTAFILAHHDGLLNKDGTLSISWTPVAGAESYELEWTYVSDQDGNNVNQRLSYDKIQLRDYLFRTNSSRVSSVNTTYEIPLMYEKGLILYRVRAVGKNIVNGKITEVKSLWSANENFTNLSSFPASNIYPFDGLETDLNWQSSISYAEEGKNKVVVSYHDGTSRNRQSVTKINTDKRAIVGETMYDYNGRAQLQLLPVPVKKNNTEFAPNFNITEGKNRIEKSQYDKSQLSGGCLAIAPKFSVDSGASNYYSPNNAFDGSGGNTGDKILNRNLIPDAKKYPYTQSFYTNDNTGRIAAQSGVGENYYIGSGHETKYLYGAPDQPELTRLFGTQVGNAGHYKKNVVIDPNGQTSVSYLDMDGKVIATALSGKIPDNVTELEDSKSRTIQANLLDNVSYPLGGTGDYKEYLSTFTVGEATKYLFGYTGTVGGYTFSCQDKVTGVNKTVSLAGVVDVEFKLIDKCKNILIESFSTTNYSTTSAAVQGINLPITVGGGAAAGEITLNPGEYNVIKRVSINQQKLEEYWNHYVGNTAYNCVLTNQNFIDQEKAKIELSGCAVNCQECQNQAQQLLNAPDVTLSAEERYRIEHLCDNLCSDNFKCLSGLNTMIADVSPGGQYGEIRRSKVTQPSINGPDKNDFANTGGDYNSFEISLNSANESGGDADNPDDNALVPETFPLSVFNDHNRLKTPGFICNTDNKITWRNPVRVYFTNETSGTPTSILYTNFVLFDGNKNFQQAHYEETNYRNLQGQIVYASLTEVSPNVYSPAVSRPDLVELVPDVQGLYRIPIKYLQNFKDFYPYWQGHFANYLVFYHPEFEYFIKCTGNQVSNAFESKLMAVSSYEDAKALNLIDNQDMPKILENDPLLANDSRAAQRLNYIFNHYSTYNNTVRTMNQIVGQSVDCPAGGDQCSPFTDAVCYNGKINTTQKWIMLVGLYLGERQSYEHDKFTAVAVNGGYFNGCIGDRNFYSKRDARNWFYQPYTNNAPAININFCKYNYWWHNAVSSNNCCIPVPRGTFSYLNFPPLDFSQTCNWWNAHQYSDRARRFEPTSDMVNNGLSLKESDCTVPIPAVGSDPAYNLEVACKENVEDFIHNGTRDAEILKYESCGLCPIANDLEQFLVELKKKTVFSNGVESLVTCITASTYVPLGGTLQKVFVPANDGAYPKVFWKGILSNANKTLTGTLHNDATANNSTIVTRTVTLNIPAGVNKTFADITFCCLKPAVATVGGMHAFQMEASYIANGATVKFMIDGTVDISLAPCTFPPRCYTTSQATETANFLNALLIDVYKPKQLQQQQASQVVVLSTDDVRAYYEPNIRVLINKTDLNTAGQYPEAFTTFTPKWLALKTGAGNLEGQLTFTGTSMNTINVSITPTVAGSIDSYNNISRFTNVRPADLATCSEAMGFCEEPMFKADAVFVGSNGSRTYREVTIQVSSLTMTVCKPIVFQKQ